jgi:sphinganine-1-phosphate aldolase
MNFLGYEGYTELARVVRETTEKLKDGISSIPGLFIHGVPDMSVFAFGSEGADIMSVGDQMDDRGWHLDRQNDPDALHLMVTPNHSKVVDAFLSDLAGSAEQAGESRGVEARYS